MFSLKSLIPVSKYKAKDIFRWLWRAWRGNRLQAVLNAAIGLATVAVSLLNVWAIQHAIDVASGVVKGDIYLSVAFIGGLILCDFGLSISSTWVENILGIRAQNRMQQKMLDRILHSEWHGKEKYHSGDVLNRLEFDVTNVVGFLTETIPSALSILAMFIGAFLYLFMMDAVLAIITVAIIPVFIALSKVYVAQMRRLTRDVRSEDSNVQSTLQETIQHRMLIKTLEGENPMVDRLEQVQSRLRHKVIKRTKFSVFSNTILNLGFALGYLVAFLWAAIRMSMHSLTFGGMTAFLQLVNRIQRPARNLTKLVPAFVSVFTAAERLMELEENPLEEQGDPIRMKAPCGIRLDHVSYAYDDIDGEVLKDLTFDFKPGTCTAVLGETGAGKTTLVRIILALIKPQSGRATIYSEERKEKSEESTPNSHIQTPNSYLQTPNSYLQTPNSYLLTPNSYLQTPNSYLQTPNSHPQTPNSYLLTPNSKTLSPLTRCNLAYVPQGNTLLSGTIRDNLRLGKLSATDEEMKEALHSSCADFVFDLPDGLDTICGEQGGGLSEGQAQRIAIARALLRNRPIILFDEATSALDPDTEKQLLHNILSDNNKTIIFITHRLAVTEYCDQTLRIEKI